MFAKSKKRLLTAAMTIQFPCLVISFISTQSFRGVVRDRRPAFQPWLKRSYTVSNACHRCRPMLGFGPGGNQDESDALTCDVIISRCLDGWEESSCLQDTSNKMSTTPFNVSPMVTWQEPPTLTEEERQRRQEEIFHLTSLTLGEGDSAILKLMRLWFTEKGRTAGRELGGAEWLFLNGNWEEAELCLYGLVMKHGIHWVEPIHRLALMLYHRGKFEESRLLLSTVLAIKPWHFGAQKGMAKVCTKLGKPDDATKWDAQCLPPMSEEALGSKRTDWVWRAVNHACGALDRAEELLQEEDEEEDDSDDSDMEVNDWNDVWQ
mmetsp:Transcript_15766/g.24523  ORF Transcript_15766/g.24523 Transcript_15766/m.24523 type:complete len:320 (-) Transcript_15766:361-1320(-)